MQRDHRDVGEWPKRCAPIAEDKRRDPGALELEVAHEQRRARPEAGDGWASSDPTALQLQWWRKVRAGSQELLPWTSTNAAATSPTAGPRAAHTETNRRGRGSHPVYSERLGGQGPSFAGGREREVYDHASPPRPSSGRQLSKLQRKGAVGSLDFKGVRTSAIAAPSACRAAMLFSREAPSGDDLDGERIVTHGIVEA